MPCRLIICPVVKVVNRERFWSTPLPALTGADLEDTMEEDIMEEDIMGDIMASRHTVGTAVFLPRLTASCPAMESSAHRPALSSASPLAG